MILITGGVKSGKSTLALELALKIPKPRVFVATSVPFDSEMRSKIKRHRTERGNGFILHEEPTEISALIEKAKANVVLIDCVTTWVGNLMHYGKNTNLYFANLLDSLKGNEILVTNEVGHGIIPENPLARDYLNLLGNINKSLAKRADEVYLMVSGIKVKIK
ncbi:MAG: bifunctional adenosylcobinamide kinase/adenosylcobinamide-phosphate guanylyltransferase [Elusimicrobia bacterium]|nr:bifunctional adenosylcobinamide kinase/adenosylcobinamide-phosphate guanylyltransferase [Elusimicrobiota bacterium]